MTKLEEDRILGEISAEEGAIRYHEARKEDLLKQLSTTGALAPKGNGTPKSPEALEAELEALPWKEAASHKCDYCREVRLDLVGAVREAKGGVKGEDHHFTASSSEPTLFRFARRESR